MIKVNLLPKEVQEKGKGADWVILGAGVVVLLALSGTASYLLKLQGYKKDIEKKARWSQQLADIKAKVQQVEQLDAQKNLLNAKRETVYQLFQGRLLYPKVMEAFYDTLPREVWVTDVALAEDPQKNMRITATSNSLSTEAIAQWLSTLESHPQKFSSIVLSAIEVKPASDPRNPASYGFTLSFILSNVSGT